MNLFEIFDIRFQNNISNSNKEYIIEKINKIKISKILNINKEILQQYFIVLSLTSIYSKNFKKFNNSFMEYILNSDSYIDNSNDSIEFDINEFMNISNLSIYNAQELLQDNYDTNDTSNIIANDANDTSNIIANDANDTSNIIANDANDANDTSNIIANNANDTNDDEYDDEYDNEYDDEYDDEYDAEYDDEYDNETNDKENQNKNKKKIKFQRTDYIQLHLFQKKYDNYTNIWLKDTCTYITTFFLNEDLLCEANYDMNNQIEIEKSSIIEMLNIDYFYNNYFKNYNDLNLLYDFTNNFETLDNYYMNNLNKIYTGMYFNNNSICLQILLYLYITTHIGHKGTLIRHVKYHKYMLNNTLVHYFNNDSTILDNIIDKTIAEEMYIMCDNCNIQISNTLYDKYYHSNISGDLCERCYLKKENIDKCKQTKLFKLMLLQGQRIIFNKELNKTKEFLKNYKIKKIKKKQYYKLIENTNNALIQKNKYTNYCGICCDILDSEIFVGSNCGHCFHKTCIKNNLSYNCPVCRKNTPFIKLYFNLDST